MTKKSRIDLESIPMRKSDILLVMAPSAESVIALSAPTMLPSVEVPSARVEMVRDEDTAPEPPVAPSVGVRVESAVTVEPELYATVQVIPQVVRSRA